MTADNADLCLVKTSSWR